MFLRNLNELVRAGMHALRRKPGNVTNANAVLDVPNGKARLIRAEKPRSVGEEAT
jgi:hypothetical protein